MRIENIDYLSKYHRNIIQLMKNLENKKVVNSSIELVISKSELPTIKVSRVNGEAFIHSKYDPLKESERIFKKYEAELSNHSNVLFFGIGLGYHVEPILKQYPEKNYYLYEPDPDIFYTLLDIRDLSNIVNKAKYHLLIPENEIQSKEMLVNISASIDEEILLIVHPSYENLFKEELHKFTSVLKEILENRKFNLTTNVVFQKRWTLNCVKNLKHTLKTPNILAHSEKNPLKGKPIILAAAGPSLNEELTYLKQIKKEGTAYIFTVGSANKVLLKNGIEPDAVCTYDPQGHNFKVFEELIEQGIKHIPMIYGTSVGYETLEKYEGPKLHMITSQDVISPFFYENMNYNTVNDAPSIAVVTLQMLLQLQASLIILVGQNLAYRENEFYAKGIEYENRTQELSEKDKINQRIVKGISGVDLYTNEGFLRMKESMEHYLNIWGSTNVINTTVGGAEIKGAPFQPLSKVMAQYLNTKVVNEQWIKEFAQNKGNDDEYLKKMDSLKKSHHLHIQTTRQLTDTIDKIGKNQNSSEQKIEKLLNRLDKQVKRLEGNLYYELFIQSIMKVEREKIMKASREIKYMKSAKEKAPKIIDHFGRFVQNIVINSEYMESAFIELENEIVTQ